MKEKRLHGEDVTGAGWTRHVPLHGNLEDLRRRQHTVPMTRWDDLQRARIGVGCIEVDAKGE